MSNGFGNCWMNSCRLARFARKEVAWRKWIVLVFSLSVESVDCCKVIHKPDGEFEKHAACRPHVIPARPGSVIPLVVVCLWGFVRDCRFRCHCRCVSQVSCLFMKLGNTHVCENQCCRMVPFGFLKNKDVLWFDVAVADVAVVKCTKAIDQT